MNLLTTNRIIGTEDSIIYSWKKKCKDVNNFSKFSGKIVIVNIPKRAYISLVRVHVSFRNMRNFPLDIATLRDLSGKGTFASIRISKFKISNRTLEELRKIC